MAEKNKAVLAFKNSDNKFNKLWKGYDIISNPVYIRKMIAMMKDALGRGCDVLHLSNGSIIVTETKVVTYHYIWDNDKGKFERAKSGMRSAKSKKRHQDMGHQADLAEEEMCGELYDDEEV